MAGTTLYLIRSNNLTFAKQEGVIDVFLSGSQTAYASVTGNASTEVVTIIGATLANGMQVTFTSLTGGSGLNTGTAYYVIAASGATCQLSLTEGGSAIDFTTNITAGSVIVSNEQMRVWSSEFRDIFTASTGIGTDVTEVPTSGPGSSWTATQTISSPVAALPNGLKNYQGVVNQTGTQTGAYTWTLMADSFVANVSDEINHFPLRQTLLNKTFWLFDRGASATPRYLPAEYQEGDIIATSPPNIP
jgi:hypothetical protein